MDVEKFRSTVMIPGILKKFPAPVFIPQVVNVKYGGGSESNLRAYPFDCLKTALIKFKKYRIFARTKAKHGRGCGRLIPNAKKPANNLRVSVPL